MLYKVNMLKLYLLLFPEKEKKPCVKKSMKRHDRSICCIILTSKAFHSFE